MHMKYWINNSTRLIKVQKREVVNQNNDSGSVCNISHDAIPYSFVTEGVCTGKKTMFAVIQCMCSVWLPTYLSWVGRVSLKM